MAPLSARDPARRGSLATLLMTEQHNSKGWTAPTSKIEKSLFGDFMETDGNPGDRLAQVFKQLEEEIKAKIELPEMVKQKEKLIDEIKETETRIAEAKPTEINWKSTDTKHNDSSNETRFTPS